MEMWLIRKCRLQNDFYQLGVQNPIDSAKKYIRHLFIVLIINSLLFVLFFSLLINPIFLLIGGILNFLYLRTSIRLLKHKVEVRKNELRSSLPIFLTNCCVLLTAGAHIQNIFLDSINFSERKGPFEDELSKLINRLHNGISFSTALYSFANQSNISEIHKLVYFIQLHLRNGEDLLHHFVKLNHDLWTDKKYRARKNGEEASAKLLFPMMILLISLIATLLFPVYELM